jgi:predicted NAD/FAD-dependent oxidoreductase
MRIVEDTAPALAEHAYMRLAIASVEADPRLFDLDPADIVHLVRWPYAVPVVGPGYYRRLAQLSQSTPIAYAGDWLVQPCAEGAVRSGEAAAAVFPLNAPGRDGRGPANR